MAVLVASIARTRAVAVTIASIKLGMLAIAAPADAIPPPPIQHAANCTSPTYASDQLVCSDPDLLAIDRAVAEAVQVVGDAVSSPNSPLVEAQEAWFRRRSLCARMATHKDCLMAAYADRLVVLKAMTAPPPSSPPTWTCEVKQFGAVTIHSLPTALVLIDPASGKVAGVASNGTSAGKSGWLPFLRILSSRRKTVLIDSYSTTSRCQPASRRPAK